MTTKRAGLRRNSAASSDVDCDRVAAELLRALRGRKRSRAGFSRVLGYKSNVAQRWETGLSWPTASDLFRIAQRTRIDVKAKLAAFFRHEPGWLSDAAIDDRLPARILRELQGRARLGAIAHAAGHNRFSVSRWLSGDAVPKLPQFLRVIEAASGRVVDFVAAFVEPSALPSIAPAWQQLVTSRELAYERPMSHAVLRALELDAYRADGHRDPRFLSRTLSVPPAELDQCLSLLVRNGQVRRTRRGFRPVPLALVDTGADPERARALRIAWGTEALKRLRAGSPGRCGYSLFSISKSDLKRLHEIQLAYMREMRAVIAASTANECVGLFCTQLLDLSGTKGNTFSPQ